jgi:hypothetical protein
MGDFFQPSEYSIKLRRNLLFLCITYILHTSIQPLTDLKVFEVNIPSELLNIGIPLFIIWFTLNYFYYLFSENIQWKASFMEEEIKNNYLGSAKAPTLIPVIARLKPGSFILDLNLSGQMPDFSRWESSDIESRLEEAFVSLSNNFKSKLDGDIKLINAFQNSFKSYHLASKLRYWILDNATPFVMIIFCFISKIYFPYTP